MKRVCIALATYNGEKFLEEQIISIINQTYKNWELYISDDASLDNTLGIINKFAEQDSRIHFVNNDRKGGVIKNFNSILMALDSDYIVLCDQDDIWPKERLEILLNEIIKKENDNDKSTPVMIFSNLELIDESNNLIHKNLYIRNKLNPISNLNKFNLLWKSSVYGCSTIFNKKLVDISTPIPAYAHMHDQWLALHASIYGKLYYLPYTSVLYRQHGNNVVGAADGSIYGKLKRFNRNINKINISVQNTISHLRNDKLSSELNIKSDNKMELIKFSIKYIFPELVFSRRAYDLIFLFLFIYNVLKSRV